MCRPDGDVCADRDSHRWLLCPGQVHGLDIMMRMVMAMMTRMVMAVMRKVTVMEKKDDYSLSSSAATGDCELGPSWLLWLCVVFGVLFLVSNDTLQFNSLKFIASNLFPFLEKLMNTPDVHFFLLQYQCSSKLMALSKFLQP